MAAIIELHDDVAIKYFDDVASYSRELKVYQSVLPHVPHLVDYGKADSNTHFIKAERVYGIPYLNEPCFPVLTLAAAISAFHLATLSSDGQCLCHIDNQPKNILLSNNEYCFIDFSDSRVDYPETDISHLLLFWAAEFEHQQFVDLSGSFITLYQRAIRLNSEQWQQSLLQSIARFDLRRIRHGRNLAHSHAQTANREWLKQVMI